MESEVIKFPANLRSDLCLLVLEHLKNVSLPASIDYEKALRGLGLISNEDNVTEGRGFGDGSETLYELIRGLLSFYIKRSRERPLESTFDLIPRLRGHAQLLGGFLFSDITSIEREKRALAERIAPSRFLACRQTVLPSRIHLASPGNGDPVCPYYEKQYKVLGHHFSSSEGFQSDCSTFCCVYDNTGRYLCTGADNGRIKLWSTNSCGEGMWLVNFFTLPSYVSDLGFSADNETLIAIDNRRISLFDWKSQKLDPLISQFDVNCSEYVSETSGLRVSPISQPHGVQAALIGSTEGYMHLFRWKMLSDEDRERADYSLRCRSDEQSCFLASQMSWTGQGENQLWRELWTIKQYLYKRDKVDSAAFHPSGLMFAHGGSDGYIYIYGLVPTATLTEEDAQIYTYKRPHHTSIDMKAMESNRIVLQHQRCFGFSDWSLKPVLLARVDAHRGCITNIAWNPSGDKLLSESTDGSIKVWKDSSISHFLYREASSKPVYKGLELLFKSSVRPELLERYAVYVPPRVVYPARAAQSLATSEADISGHQTVSEQERGSVLSASCWSADGRQIIAASREHLVCVFNGETGRLEHILEGDARESKHESRVALIRPHPFLSHITLTAGWDGLISVWNTVLGHQVQAWTVTGLVFDGNWSPLMEQFAITTSQGRLLFFSKSVVEPENPYLPDQQREQNLDDQVCQVQMRYSRAYRGLETFLEQMKDGFKLQRHEWERQIGVCPESQYFHGELVPSAAGSALGQNLRANSSSGSASRRSQQAQLSQQSQTQSNSQPRQVRLLGTAVVSQGRIDPRTLADVKGVPHSEGVQQRARRAQPQNLFARVCSRMAQPIEELSHSNLLVFINRASEFTLDHADYVGAIAVIEQLALLRLGKADDDKLERARRRRFLAEPKEDTFDEIEMAIIMQEQEEERTWREMMAPNAPLVPVDNMEADPDFEIQSNSGSETRRRNRRSRALRRAQRDASSNRQGRSSRRRPRRQGAASFLDLEAEEDFGQEFSSDGDYHTNSETEPSVVSLAESYSESSASSSFEASSTDDSESESSLSDATDDDSSSKVGEERAEEKPAKFADPRKTREKTFLQSEPGSSSALKESNTNGRRSIRKLRETISLDDIFDDEKIEEKEQRVAKKGQQWFPKPRTDAEWWVSSKENVSFPYVPQRGDVVAISVAGMKNFQENLALSEVERQLQFVNPQVISSYYLASDEHVDNPMEYSEKEFIYGIVYKLEYSMAKSEVSIPRSVQREHDEWRKESAGGSSLCYVRVRMECVLLHSSDGSQKLGPGCTVATVPHDVEGSANSVYRIRTVLGDFNTFRKLRFALSFHETVPLYQFVVPLESLLCTQDLDLKAGETVYDAVLQDENKLVSKISEKQWMEWETAEPADISEGAGKRTRTSMRVHSGASQSEQTLRSAWQCAAPFELWSLLTSAHSRQLSKYIEKFARAEEYQIFFEPVDLEAFPDYLMTVAYPMSFSKILGRLANNYYRQFDALLGDIDILIRNIKRYNTPDSTIYSVADHELTEFRNEVASFGAKFAPHFPESGHLGVLKASRVDSSPSPPRKARSKALSSSPTKKKPDTKALIDTRVVDTGEKKDYFESTFSGESDSSSEVEDSDGDFQPQKKLPKEKREQSRRFKARKRTTLESSLDSSSEQSGEEEPSSADYSQSESESESEDGRGLKSRTRQATSRPLRRKAKYYKRKSKRKRNY